MLIKTKFFLAAAVSLCIAGAAGAKPIHHPSAFPNDARGSDSYALAPSLNGQVSALGPAVIGATTTIAPWTVTAMI